jgi:hypothetical protein
MKREHFDSSESLEQLEQPHPVKTTSSTHSSYLNKLERQVGKFSRSSTNSAINYDVVNEETLTKFPNLGMPLGDLKARSIQNKLDSCKDDEMLNRASRGCFTQLDQLEKSEFGHQAVLKAPGSNEFINSNIESSTYWNAWSSNLEMHQSCRETVYVKNAAGVCGPQLKDNTLPLTHIKGGRVPVGLRGNEDPNS